MRTGWQVVQSYGVGELCSSVADGGIMHLFGSLIVDLFIQALQVKRFGIPPRRAT